MTAGRQWLADLTAKWGKSRIGQAPVRLHDSSGTYERECWVWFPHGTNHNLAIDRYAGRARPITIIRAGGCTAHAVVTLYGPDAPPDATIRQVLVLAGMLDAEAAAASPSGTIPASVTAGTL